MDPAIRIESLLAEARWLEQLARRLVGDRAQADDLVQDVWRAALERAPTGVTDPRGWLARVLTNRWRELRRRRDARSARELRHARAEALPATADVVARADAQRALVECVLALDEPWRRAVLWRYFDGLSSEEIARRERVSPSTMRNRLSHALELLRARLARRRGTSWFGSIAALVPELHGRALEPAGSAFAAKSIGGGATVAATGKIAAGTVAAAVLGIGLWYAIGSADPVPPMDPVQRSGSDVALETPDPRAPIAVDGERRVASALEVTASAPARAPAPTAKPAREKPPVPPGVILGEIVRDGKPGARSGHVELLPGTMEEFPAAPELVPGHERVPVLEDGTFQFAGLAAGDYTLSAQLPDRVTLSDYVRVPAEGPGVRVVLEIGGARLTGHVWDEEGRPRVGARISIGLRSAVAAGGTTLRDARADESGRYAIEALAGGIYDGVLIVGGADGRLAFQRHFNVSVPKDAERVLDFGQDRPWPTWTGTLRTRAGAPVTGGATLHVRDETRRGSLETAGCEPDGTFRIRLLPGTYSVDAQPVNSGKEHELGQVTVGRADIAQDLVLPGTRLSGRALYANGEPLPRVGSLTVGVRPPQERWPGAFRTAPVATDGSFKIEGLPPGTYGVYPHPLALAGGPESITFDVVEGQDEIVLTITLRNP